MKQNKPMMLATLALFVVGCGTVQSGSNEDMQKMVSKAIASSFLPGENQDLSRLKQDETIQACNKYRDQPPSEVAAAIIAREKQNIAYPADGKLMGDWKAGEKLYKMGFAYRIGSVEPDSPKKDRGGNCYACHAADPAEVAFGTIGPSLTGYGKQRGTSDAVVRYTYDKIYNAQSLIACSRMPRLGHNGILNPEKVAHITAFLLSPDSPVNK